MAWRGWVALSRCGPVRSGAEGGEQSSDGSGSPLGFHSWRGVQTLPGRAQVSPTHLAHVHKYNRSAITSCTPLTAPPRPALPRIAAPCHVNVTSFYPMNGAVITPCGPVHASRRHCLLTRGLGREANGEGQQPFIHCPTRTLVTVSGLNPSLNLSEVSHL